MSLTNDQLLERIEIIEAKLNEMQTAFDNVATKKQLKNLFGLQERVLNEIQKDIDALTAPGGATDMEERISTLEALAIRLATKAQLNQLLTIRQTEIDTLKEKVATLEAQVQVLQS